MWLSAKLGRIFRIPKTPFLGRNHLKTHCNTSAGGQVARRRLTAVGPPAILAPFGRATSTDDAMKNPKARKTSAKNPGGLRSAKTLAAKRARQTGTKASVTLDTGGKLTFNHAMIYVKDVERGFRFYRDLLGFKLIEDFRYEGTPVYARMRAPGGDGTIALHQAGPDVSVASDGVRLYFEVRDLDGFCRTLQQKGFYITRQPRMMPWGWRHAYLNDPDGHEISLYWAGENRMKKTVMKAAQKLADIGSKP
jgi:catechol 2,3-dioxygenase-like lactoylglutathione lyase family enzyme